MIANKVLPSFYSLELEGEAAKMEHLLGVRCKIKSVTIHSYDLTSDIEAANLGTTAFKNVTDKVGGEIEFFYNPEFFPSLPVIEPTLEQDQIEEAAREKLDTLEEEQQVSGTILTRRFDEWGDFVVMKAKCFDSTHSAILKVAAHPKDYILQKNLEKQEHIARLHGLTTPSGTAVIH